MALKDLEEYDLRKHTLKLKISLDTDIDKKTREEKQYEIDYNKKSEQFIICEEQYEKNKDKAYVFLCERCARKMQNKIKILNNFELNVEDDQIEL